MSRLARYFPSRLGAQSIWLSNFDNKIAGYQTQLGFTAQEIADIRADAQRAAWLLSTYRGAAEAFAQAVTAHVSHILNGSAGEPGSEPPVFALPSTPAPPANVPPGALRRIFAFIKNLKTRAGYTESIGENLGIIGPGETAGAGDERPEATAEPRSGEVVIKFKKSGHMGVWIEGQVGAETDWTYLAIDTGSPYNDARPLKVAGQPEKRRYRLCFWDGDPSRVWSNVIEVVFGG